MRLERKLFLSFGLLLLGAASAIYFFSDYFFVSTKLQLLFATLAVIVVALLITWAIVRHIAKPLSSLVEAASKVREGKFEEVRLPSFSKRRQDEVAILTASFQSMVEGLIEREKIRGVLNKVVSKDIADVILRSGVKLGGEDLVVTILFSDIRNFTSMTEKLKPQEVIEILNDFMTKMTHVIEGEGGIIDKYIGDEIMALFGAPIFHPDHALRAISSARIMMETLKKWNDERESQGRARIEMGIGIHTGIVVAGNMGAADRLNYTVLGSGVNLASRLCASAAGGQILISEYTLNQPSVKDSFFVNSLPELVVKGFSHPIKNYEITGFKWEP